MSIGVSCHDFWFGDYTYLKHYVRAFEITQERETEDKNFFAYLSGLYNNNALSANMSTYMWWKAGKRGKQPDPYLSKPIPITEREKREDLEERKRKTIEWFMKGQEE